MTISGPNVAEVVGVFFGRSFVDVQPLSQNEIQLSTPGGVPGNVEVKLDFVGEGDVVVPGGFTYVESEPDASEQPGSPTTIVEPPLAETGASTAPIGLLAAALVVGGASALLLVSRRRHHTLSHTSSRPDLARVCVTVPAADRAIGDTKLGRALPVRNRTPADGMARADAHRPPSATSVAAP